MGFPIPLWPSAFVFPLALCFYYFLLAGGRTLKIKDGDDLQVAVAQVSFLSGLFGTIWLGIRMPVPIANAAGGAALMVCALLLFEWARHSVRDRGFRIAWSGEVPEGLCEQGPYRFVRHPLYASYIVAFAAQLVALPSWWTLVIFAFNAGLFIHAAFDDERSMARSELAADYAAYRMRTGMFLPRLGKRARARARPD